MRIHPHHYRTGTFCYQQKVQPSHDQITDNGNSNVLVLSIILFVTSLIVGALIMIWYFYSKKNEEQEVPTSPNTPPHLNSIYQPPPFHSIQTKVLSAPQEVSQPKITPPIILMHQGIQTSGSLNPPIPKSHYEVQTEKMAEMMNRAIQTSDGMDKTRKTQGSGGAPDKPPTPVSAFQILKSSGDIAQSETIIPPVKPLAQIQSNQIASRFRSQGPDVPLAVSRVLGSSKHPPQTKSEITAQNTPPFIPLPSQHIQPSAFNLIDTGNQRNSQAVEASIRSDNSAQMYVKPKQALQTTQMMTPTPLGISQPLIIPVLGPPLPPLPPLPPMVNPALPLQQSFTPPPLPPLPPIQTPSPPSGLRKTPPQGLQYPTLPSIPKSFPVYSRGNPAMGWPGPYRGF